MKHSIFKLVSLGILVMCGCGGGDDIERVNVSGMVTLQGHPVEQGSITFIPKGAGPAAGAMIENGRYQISGEKAPSPGLFRIEIRSARPTGKQMIGTDGVTPEPVFEEAIPAKYNSNSKLEESLTAGTSNELNFDLN